MNFAKSNLCGASRGRRQCSADHTHCEVKVGNQGLGKAQAWPPGSSSYGHLLDDMVRAARRCERASAVFSRHPVEQMIRPLMDACDEVGKAWSGSFIGYHATVYIAGLHPK